MLVPVPDVGYPESFLSAHEMYMEALLTDHHDAAAMAGIATLRLFGWGIGQDYDIAFELFSRAAKLVHARGQAGLGILLANGWGRPCDYTAAFMQLHQAAAQVRWPASRCSRSTVACTASRRRACSCQQRTALICILFEFSAT